MDRRSARLWGSCQGVLSAGVLVLRSLQVDEPRQRGPLLPLPCAQGFVDHGDRGPQTAGRGADAGSRRRASCCCLDPDVPSDVCFGLEARLRRRHPAPPGYRRRSGRGRHRDCSHGVSRLADAGRSGRRPEPDLPGDPARDGADRLVRRRGAQRLPGPDLDGCARAGQRIATIRSRPSRSVVDRELAVGDQSGPGLRRPAAAVFLRHVDRRRDPRPCAGPRVGRLCLLAARRPDHEPGQAGPAPQRPLGAAGRSRFVGRPNRHSLVGGVGCGPRRRLRHRGPDLYRHHGAGHRELRLVPFGRVDWRIVECQRDIDGDSAGRSRRARPVDRRRDRPVPAGPDHDRAIATAADP